MNAEVSPAAAPAATRACRLNWWLVPCDKSANIAPAAPPSCMEGPSRPRIMPEPSDMRPVKNLTGRTRFQRTGRSESSAPSISGMPEPPASGAMRAVRYIAMPARRKLREKAESQKSAPWPSPGRYFTRSEMITSGMYSKSEQTVPVKIPSPKEMKMSPMVSVLLKSCERSLW